MRFAKKIIVLSLFVLLFTQKATCQTAERVNELGVSFSAALLISGEQNATYDVIHSVLAHYDYTIANGLSLRSQAGYIFSTYNSNFKLS